MNKKNTPPNDFLDFYQICSRQKSVFWTTFFTCIAGIMLTFLFIPKQYEVFQMITLPMKTNDQPLVSQIELLKQCKPRYFENQIKKALGIPFDQKWKFSFDISRPQIKISMFVRKHEISQSKLILKKLAFLIKKKYDFELAKIHDGLIQQRQNLKLEKEKKLSEKKYINEIKHIIEKRIQKRETKLKELSSLKEQHHDQIFKKLFISHLIYDIQLAIEADNERMLEKSYHKTLEDEFITKIDLEIDSSIKRINALKSVTLFTPPTISPNRITYYPTWIIIFLLSIIVSILTSYIKEWKNYKIRVDDNE